MRLNQDQVRGLSNAIARAHGDLLGRFYALLPSEQGGVAWWRSLLDPRRVRRFSAALERSGSRVNELLSDATGVDAKAAELELDALRLQLFYLWSEAMDWQQQGLVAGAARVDEEPLSDFVPAGFTAAIEALLEFYFGDARPKDTLVAETQLAWIAAKQRSPSFLSRETRARRRRAYQRYSELWATWAKASASHAP